MSHLDITTRITRDMTDAEFAAAFSPDGLARTAQWICEDDWVVEYTTQRIRHGKNDGLFAVMLFKPKGRGSKRVWERVRMERCDTRREAKARALAYYRKHSPKWDARYPA